jgi:hypothetical protein
MLQSNLRRLVLSNVCKDARCLVLGCDGVLYENLPSQEALWDSYSTAAPARQRRYVARSNVVKKA